MKCLKVDFLLRTSALQSRAALLLCFPPFLLLVYLALPLLENSIVPTIWHAVHADLKGPAFPFLLLNCVTLTIFASSKLGSEKRGHEEEIQGELALKIVEKGEKMEDDVAECVLGGASLNIDAPPEKDVHGEERDAAETAVVPPCLDLHTPLENGGQELGGDAAESAEPSLHLVTAQKLHCPDLPKKNEDHLLRRSRSLNACFDVNKPECEQVKPKHGKERKPNIVRSRARLASRSDDKVRLHPNKPLSNELAKKQLITSSHAADSESTQHERPTQKTKNSPRPQQAQNPAPAGVKEHPSMDEVWAAIKSTKKKDDCKQEEEQSQKTDLKTADAAATTSKAKRAAAAVLASSAALASNTPHPLADTNLLKVTKVAAPNLAGKAFAAAVEQRLKDRRAEAENGGELEKLNRRAELFIGRFNYQMRLQREESLRRRKGGCRPLKSYGVLPARGSLVG